MLAEQIGGAYQKILRHDIVGTRPQPFVDIYDIVLATLGLELGEKKDKAGDVIKALEPHDACRRIDGCWLAHNEDDMVQKAYLEDICPYSWIKLL